MFTVECSTLENGVYIDCERDGRECGENGWESSDGVKKVQNSHTAVVKAVGRAFLHNGKGIRENGFETRLEDSYENQYRETAPRFLPLVFLTK